MSDWDVKNYLRFDRERIRPCVDLVRTIDLDHPREVVDLGCGPGNSLSVLKSRWPDAAFEGVDSSPEMLELARASDDRVRWTQSDIRSWSPRHRVDLVFSNAALHWVPDHATLLPGLLDGIVEGGTLAFQVPIRGDPPPAWVEALGRARRASGHDGLTLTDPAAENVLAPEQYYRVLATRAARVDIWDAEYQHVLERPDDVAEWTRTTALRPILAQLPSEGERGRFLETYLRELRRAYPRQPDGRVLFPFRRRFVIACLPARGPA